MSVARLDEEVSPEELEQWKALYQLEEEDPDWTRQEHLLAALIEEVSAGLLRLAFFKVGKSAPVPSRPTQIDTGQDKDDDGVSDAVKALMMMSKL